MSPDIQWVVLELTSKADGEDPDTIMSSIRHHIRDAEIFIPASVVQRGPIREFKYLVDGYAFVRHKHPDPYYSRLEDTKYVQTPLYHLTGNRREKKLATVSNSQIETLRSQITIEVDQGIDIGDAVMITSGPYKNIKATVREEIPEQDSVVVHIHLRSTDRLVTLPRAFLHLESKSSHLAYGERVRRVRTWVEAAGKVARWSDEKLLKLNDRKATFERLEDWVDHSVSLYRWFNAFYAALDLSLLTDRYRALQTLDAFAALKPEPVARNMEAPGLNLIIDGTQLFIRCSEAPGLGSLTDRDGRHTGGVVGFLRSLASYRKRFPQGSIYICWDGNSRRRKAMFAGYKGNRISRSETPSFGWAWLREVLPMLGVHQAFNTEEEADDVMATLVRGPLRGATNLMITSDRDLLQVVTEFTHQLCPAMGGGKEKLYGPADVEAEYGVPPTLMVQLRALSGDASDHIPGVPGFGLKTAAKALKPYGNVSALFQSNLAGLSKVQSVNLRASERQVLLNIELMSLRDVPFTQIRANTDQAAAHTRIKALNIRPEPILTACFGALAHAEAVSDVGI
jgi:5'-3' exonuclease/transcription antitermination factor NusG